MSDEKNPTRNESGPASDPASDGDGLVALAVIVVQNFRLLVVLTVVGVFLSVALSFLLPDIFKAEARIIPSSLLNGEGTMGLSSALRGASAMMGVNLGGTGGDMSQLFSEILRSKELISEVLMTEYVKRDSTRCTLAEFLDPDFTGTPRQVAELAGRFNRDILKIRLDAQTGVSTVAIELEDPLLTYKVVNTCIERLDVHNQRMMQSQTSQLVKFLNERQADSERQLAEAEIVLQQFSEKNRRIEDSPTLLFEQARLLRAVKLKTEAYLLLSSQLELARIEVFRNLPSIIVLDSAQRPYKKCKPSRAIILVVSGCLFFFAGFCFVLLRDGRHRFLRYMRTQRI